MTWTAEDLSNLDNAIKSGVLEVRYGDKTVRYNTLDKMLSLRDVMQREVNRAAGTSSRTTVATYRGCS